LACASDAIAYSRLFSEGELWRAFSPPLVVNGLLTTIIETGDSRLEDAAAIRT
jgi:hypothetical protein